MEVWNAGKQVEVVVEHLEIPGSGGGSGIVIFVIKLEISTVLQKQLVVLLVSMVEKRFIHLQALVHLP